MKNLQPANSGTLTSENATIISNEILCDEHYRMILEAPSFPPALPGQFVMIRATTEAGSPPFYLRRAFSISGMKNIDSKTCVEILYRAIGRATKWMKTLQPGQSMSIAGPMGKPFPVPENKQHAWFVGGGVGLPPVMWMAQHTADKWESGVLFTGAQSKNLLPLHLLPDKMSSSSSAQPSHCTEEMVESGIPVVLCTDDGSAGFQGNVLEAMKSLWHNHPLDPDTLVIYACGPEKMLAVIQDWASAHKIKTWLSMERDMACGMGTCQSCVVPLKKEGDPNEWEYHLCCKDGPVFEGDRIIWDDPQKS